MLIEILLTFIASETNFLHLTSKWKKYILLFTNKWFLGMWGVQTCKRRSSHITQDYHFIKFRLFLVNLGCRGSVIAFRIVMCLLRLALFANVFLTVQCCVSVQLLGSCPPSQKKFRPHPRFDLLKFLSYWLDSTKCQNMFRWSGQNANQKVGTDKMLTTEKSPDKMPTFGWHYVRLAFCPVGILSYHQIFFKLN